MIRNRVLRTGIFCLYVGAATAAASNESILFDGLWEYEEDGGGAFGKKENGFEYGWETGRNAQNAESEFSPSEKYDTYVAMPAGAKWEMTVPDGIYKVLVVAGDPVSRDADLRVTVEGMPALNEDVRGRKFWATGRATVEVTDGRLTIEGGAGARNNNLLYLHVYSAMYGYYPSPKYAELPLRINCGGGAFPELGWKADQKWMENSDFGFIAQNEDGAEEWKHDTEGEKIYCANRMIDYREVPESVTDIPGTGLDEIHRTLISQRGGKKDEVGPGFAYKVRLPEGSYDVTFYVTALNDSRDNWEQFDMHVEDKVLSLNVWDLTGQLHGGAKVTLEDVEVTDGIMNIVPVHTGWGYSWGASIAGIEINGGETAAVNDRTKAAGRLQVSVLPTAGTARITLNCLQPQRLHCEITGVDGRTVKTVADRQFSAGTHTLLWSGSNESGSKVGAGVYFLRIRDNKNTWTTRKTRF